MTIVPALEGIVAVEITSEVRGRYCGRLFAELGATVVRVGLDDEAFDRLVAEGITGSGPPPGYD